MDVIDRIYLHVEQKKLGDDKKAKKLAYNRVYYANSRRSKEATCRRSREPFTPEKRKLSQQRWYRKKLMEDPDWNKKKVKRYSETRHQYYLAHKEEVMARTRARRNRIKEQKQNEKANKNPEETMDKP